MVFSVPQISLLASIVALVWCNFGADGHPENSVETVTYNNFWGQNSTTDRPKRSSLFQRRTCLHNNLEGFCYGEVQCEHLKGKRTEFCGGLFGVCCVFLRYCGGRTAIEIAHFRNKAWPNEEVTKNSCTFSVVKQDSVCGMSLTIKKLDFPGKVGACSNTFLWIAGIPGKQLHFICGRYRGSTYVFNVTSTTEVYIVVRSQPQISNFKTSWHMVMRQIPCSQFSYEVLPQVNDGVFPSLAPIAEEPQHPITSITPVAEGTPVQIPPTAEAPSKAPPATTTINYSRCGVKGPTIEKHEASPEDSEIDPFSNLTKFPQIKTGNVDENAKLLPGVSITEWDAPELTNSVFYKLQGQRTIVDQRITHGQLADVGEFPWQVALYVGRSFHCGGSIIADDIILTAGHCVSRNQDSFGNLRVLLGAWDVRKPKKENSDSYKIRQVHVHKNYSRDSLQNDIAVLKLARKIKFKKTIRPICLPSKDLSTEGKLAFVTGWGRDESKRLMSKLHKLHAAILSNDVCGERWVKVGAKKGFIAPGMLCMDSQHGDSCNGDSGGPTVVQNPKVSGQFVQVGIVSFGSGSCTNERLPGVYTRVTHYLDWIKDHI